MQERGAAMEAQKVEVKFGEWIQKGFDLYKQNIMVLIVASLIAMVLGVATAGVLSAPLYAGVIMIVLRFMDKSEPTPVAGDVFKGFSVFLQTFLFALVWTVLLGIVASVLMIIPCVGALAALVLCVFAGAALMFGLFLIVDRKMEFWPASMTSLNMVKSNPLPFVGLSLVVSVIISLGCGIGAFVTVPIGICILAVAYRDVFGKSAQV